MQSSHQILEHGHERQENAISQAVSRETAYSEQTIEMKLQLITL